jgi:nucleotide-binding universal stress UspA family protein
MEVYMLSKILVPLDGSEMAVQVFPALAELAVTFKSEVALLGFCQPGATEEVPSCATYVRNEAAFLSAMTGSAATIKREYATTEIENEIKRYVADNQVDLVMFAGHGKKGIEPWSLDHTVNRLLHVSGIPLLVIRNVPDDLASGKDVFDNILVPLDGSERSTCILPVVVEIAGKFASKVTLIHVVEEEHHVHTVGGLDSVPFREEDVASELNKAQLYLDEVAGRISCDHSLEIRTHIARGDAPSEIRKYADNVGVTLIAMSSHVHSSLENWFYGSLTKEIIQSDNRSFLFMAQTAD